MIKLYCRLQTNISGENQGLQPNIPSQRDVLSEFKAHFASECQVDKKRRLENRHKIQRL